MDPNPNNPCSLQFKAFRSGKIIAALVLTLAGGPAALAVEVEPAISGGIVYIDNISLQPPETAISDFVLLVEPAIALSQQTNRTSASLDYRL